MTFASLLPLTATVYREGTDTYEFGVPQEDALALFGTFPCRFDFDSGMEDIALSDQRSQVREGTVYCLPGPVTDDVKRSDRVLIEGNEDEFEVVYVKRVLGMAGLHHYEMEVKRVIGE